MIIKAISVKRLKRPEQVLGFGLEKAEKRGRYETCGRHYGNYAGEKEERTDRKGQNGKTQKTI